MSRTKKITDSDRLGFLLEDLVSHSQDVEIKHEEMKREAGDCVSIFDALDACLLKSRAASQEKSL